MSRKNIHVAVLMGGWSAERDVSLASGKGVVDALESLNYQVTKVDVGRDVAARLAVLKPDVAFNALHGRFGEDGCVQGVLEVLGIPYTHSGVLASSLAMDKPLAKIHFAHEGIPCPVGQNLSRETLLAGDPIPRPYVVKPLNEGSSVGVMLMFEGQNQHFDEQSWPFGETVLVEPYIPGREIQVAVLGDKALGAIEICPKGTFYDYETKYTAGLADHLMPAPLSEQEYAQVMDYAERAHRCLGCRGLTRSDFRYDPSLPEGERFFLLEINTQPGMTPLSLAPEIAAYTGIGYAELVEMLIEEALCHGGD